MTPEMWLALVGLITLAAGYLAGRSRTLASAVKTYEGLVSDLREEINRLRAWVLDLEGTVQALRAERNKVGPEK